MLEILVKDMLLRLKEYRREQLMSQEKFAHCMGLGQTYYSQVERGEIACSFYILDELYERNCDIDYIVTGTKRVCGDTYLIDTLENYAQEKSMQLYTLMITAFIYMWDWNLNDDWERCLYSELRAMSVLSTANADFNKKLYYVRSTNGVSQQEFADMLGIGRTKCGNCERGEQELDAQLMLCLYLKGYCLPSFFFEKYIGITEISSLLMQNEEKKVRYYTYINSILSDILHD